MTSALLLNNTHSETEFIDVLKKNYKKIYTLGNQKPYNQDSKIKHFKIDYKNIKKIKFIKKKYNIKHIYPGANDLTLFTLANLKNRFVDNLAKINILHNKNLFRNFNKDINIYTQQSFKKKNINDLNYPLLAKPKIGHGGKGIFKIKDRKDLKFFFKKKNEYILEEFIEGTNHGVFTLIRNQKIIFIFFDTEQRFLNPYTVSSTINICKISNIEKKKIKDKLHQIIKKLNLKDGIFHVQIIFKKKTNKSFIIEITRRLPGDNYLKFIKYSTGISIEDCILKLFLKKRFRIYLKKKSYILRKVLMASSNGHFDKVKISENISRNIIEMKIFYLKNKKIKNFKQDRIGVIFLKFKTKKKLLTITKDIDKYIHVSVKR